MWVHACAHSRRRRLAAGGRSGVSAACFMRGLWQPMQSQGYLVISPTATRGPAKGPCIDSDQGRRRCSLGIGLPAASRNPPHPHAGLPPAASILTRGGLGSPKGGRPPSGRAAAGAAKHIFSGRGASALFMPEFRVPTPAYIPPRHQHHS